MSINRWGARQRESNHHNTPFICNFVTTFISIRLLGYTAKHTGYVTTISPENLCMKVPSREGHTLPSICSLRWSTYTVPDCSMDSEFSPQLFPVRMCVTIGTIRPSASRILASSLIFSSSRVSCYKAFLSCNYHHYQRT